jgi:virginiamycin B lyase
MSSIRSILPRVLVTSMAALTLASGAVAAQVWTAGPAAAKTGPVLKFTPSPADFGLVTTGQTGVQTLTLANSGKSAAIALKVGLSGPAAFGVIGDTCAGISLKPGASCEVTVEFAPGSAGTVNAVLTAASQKSGVSVTDVLIGTGVLGARMFWANFGAGTIMSANLDGTGETTLVSGQSGPAGVAVSGGRIYWADESSGTIDSANLDGTSELKLVTGQSLPSGVAVANGRLYWTNLGPSLGAGTIMSANLDGTGATAVVSGLNGPSGVAVDGSHIYWSSANDGTISRANLDGSGATTMITDAFDPEGVAVDSSHLYWTNAGNGTIGKANLNGTNEQTIVTGLNQGPDGLAVGPQ